MIRVASWNVREGLPDHSADPADRPAALAALTAQVRAQALDVLALQEIDVDPAGWSAVLAALREDTPLRYAHSGVLSPSTYLPGHHAAIGLASRVPIAGHGLDLLPNPGLTAERDGRPMTSYDKGLIAGTVELSGLRVTLVSVHALPFRRFGRTPEEPAFAPVWRAMADRIGKLGDGPLVVCGDFNTPRRDLLLGVADRPLARAVGDRPTHRGRATDDILYSAELALAGEPLVLPGFSDHDLCVAGLVRA